MLADGSGVVKALADANAGTPEYPNESAIIIVACSLLDSGEMTLTLTGPGVDGSATLRVAGVPAEAFTFFKERNKSCPLGVDMILADRGGRVACLPRTVALVIEY